MKVLFVTEQIILGGGETNLLDIIDYYLNQNIHVHLSAPSHAKIFDLVPETVLCLPDDNLAKKGWLSFIPFIFRAANKPKTEFDIIHFYSSNVVTKYSRYKAKKIWTIHGAWECKSFLKGLISSFFVDAVTFVSKDVKNRVSFWRDKGKLVELGVGTNKSSKLCKLKYNSSANDGLNILCLARFQKVKRQELLINSLNYIDKNINCKMIGGLNDSSEVDVSFYHEVCEMSEQFNKLNDGFKSVNIGSHVNDIANLYDWADVVVVPSDYESFSLVTAEALVSSTPVVVTDAGAPSHFIENSITGVTFDKGKSRSLALSISDMVKNFEVLDSNHFALFKYRFSIDKQGNDYLALYYFHI